MTTSTVDPAIEAAAQRPRRVSRFLRLLFGITVVVHVPVALGVAEAVRRLNGPAPWALGGAWAAAGVPELAGRRRRFENPAGLAHSGIENFFHLSRGFLSRFSNHGVHSLLIFSLRRNRHDRIIDSQID